MRLLAGVIVAALALWAGYWAIAQRMIEQNLALALADLPPEIRLSQEGIEVAGFPSRFDLTLTRPDFFHSASGWGIGADFAQLLAMTWKPWHLIAALPGDLALQTPSGPARLTSTRLMASLSHLPTASLPFSAAVIEIDSPRLTLPAEAGVVEAGKLVLALRAEPGEAAAYRLGLQITDAAPLFPPGPLAQARADVVISASAPLDLSALEVPPVITAIDVSALSLDFGDVILAGAGKVVPGPTGLAEGEIGLKVTGWQGIAAALSRHGLVPARFVPVLQHLVRLTAEKQGNPAALDLPLRFAGGLASIGDLTVGAAPRLAP